MGRPHLGKHITAVTPLGAESWGAPNGTYALVVLGTQIAGSVLQLTGGYRIVLCGSGRAWQAQNGHSVRFAAANAENRDASSMTHCQTLSVAMTRGGMPIPDTLYAKAGDAAIAYQVFGSGEHRIVGVPGAISNAELVWEWAPFHH